MLLLLSQVLAGDGVSRHYFGGPSCDSFLFLTSLHSPSARPSPVRARRVCRTAAGAAGWRLGRAGITSARAMTSIAPRPGRPSSGLLRGAEASRRPIPQYPDTATSTWGLV
jgi:hypothetical protein